MLESNKNIDSKIVFLIWYRDFHDIFVIKNYMRDGQDSVYELMS